MRNVYIVNGEHDGLIGVYSNYHKAQERAVAYALSADEHYVEPELGEGIKSPDSYKGYTSYYGLNHSWIVQEPLL